MTINTDHFKTKLEAEKKELLSELKDVGQPSITNPGEWDAKPTDTSEIIFREEVADRLEANEEREQTEKTLELRLKEVEAALAKIENNSYGQCKVCQKEIEVDRLEANPAASTCKEHIDV